MKYDVYLVRRCGVRAMLCALMIAGLSGPAQTQELSADERAAMLLNSARAAFNDGNYSVAAERFNTFLREFRTHKDLSSARYGLGITLLQSDGNYAAAATLLRSAAADANLPERAEALYYYGVALRGQGIEAARQAAAIAATQPTALPPRSPTPAARLFMQAAEQFKAAAAAFDARSKRSAGESDSDNPDMRWAMRARTDQADMLVRGGQYKDALTVLDPLLAQSGAALGPQRPQALYLKGVASFYTGDLFAAARSLALLAPFADANGPHARYLLARIHESWDEWPEAALQYEAVVTGFEARRGEAAEALKKPEAIAPQQREALERVAREPAPDYVQRALFYWGLLLRNQGELSEAAARLGSFARLYPQSPLAPEAQLQHGHTLVLMERYADAVKALAPIAEHPSLAEQGLLWLARAQVGAARAGGPATLLAAALESLQKALERVQTAPPASPSRAALGDVLLELGDTQQLAGQYKAAAATYQQVLERRNLSGHHEVAMQRRAAALQLAGLYGESQELCLTFEKNYPNSPLLAEVLFRQGENVLLPALAQGGELTPQRREMLKEAIKRYNVVIERFPASREANLARYSAGIATYQLGDYQGAMRLLSAVPEAERSGELAGVSYLLADCMIRLLPEDAGDALSTARLLEQARTIIGILGSFTNTQENDPNWADGMLKLGYCHQRVADVLADPLEQRQSLANARLVYVRLIQRSDHPLLGAATYENARVLARLGNVGSALTLLRAFQDGALKDDPISPLALIFTAECLRGQGRAADAATLLAQARERHEPALEKDPSRQAWLAALWLGHGIALRESGKVDEALALFESVQKRFKDSPEAAQARWQTLLADKDRTMAAFEASRRAVVAAANRPQSLPAAQEALRGAAAKLAQVAEALVTEARRYEEEDEASEQRLRALYEAAWCYRRLAEAEVDAARQKDATSVPPQPAEKKARELYMAIIEAAPHVEIANDARFELAEMLADRGEHDAAIGLLAEAMQQQPPLDMLERLRLRLGTSLLARGDVPRAIAQFNAIMQNQRSVWTAHAAAGLGECYVAQKDWPKAIEVLRRFADRNAPRLPPGMGERALLRFGQAAVASSQWALAQPAMEVFVQRFARSPLVHEARFILGLALQNLKQYDAAATAFTEATRGTASEIGARAQLHLGLCRLEQKRYAEAVDALLAVEYTYAYPDVTAAARYEAARGLVALNRQDDARKLLGKITQERPGTQWDQLARKRLAEIK